MNKMEGRSKLQSPMSALEDDVDICILETPTIALRILEDLSPDDEKDGVEDAVGRFVWPTAVPLLRQMLSSDTLTESSLIVELGAGCGVLGMGLAAAAGTTQLPASTDYNLHVILTDHDSDWLQRNVSLNEMMLQETSNATMAVTKLDWRNPQDVTTVRGIVRDRLSLSNHNELMIVGSDILYNHDSHRSLASTLYQLSESQPTRIILGFPDRDNDEQSFLPIAREFFGETVPSSKPIIIERKSNKKGKKMDLRLIDFKTNNLV